MKIIDTHSHLFDDEFVDDVEDVIKRAKEQGIYRVFMPDIDKSTYESLMALYEKYPSFFSPMIGLHPTSITSENVEDELLFVQQKLLTENPFIAIGEIGVDLY